MAAKICLLPAAVVAVARDLGNVGVKGTLPEQWKSFPKARFINLAENPSLTGPLPQEWSTMKVILTLNLSDTGLNGTIPGEWSTMKELKTLIITGTTNITIGKDYPTERCKEQRKSFLIIDRDHPAPGYDVTDRCKYELKQRGTIVASLVGAALLLLTIIVMWRSRKRQPAAKASAQERPWLLSTMSNTRSGRLLLRAWHGPPGTEDQGRGLKSLVPAAVTVGQVAGIVYDVATDLFLLIQIVPLDSETPWWPFLTLLVALFIPNVITAVAAWFSWLTATNNCQRGFIAVTLLTLLYITPFTCVLVMAVVMTAAHALILWHTTRQQSLKRSKAGSGTAASSSHGSHLATAASSEPAVALATDHDNSTVGRDRQQRLPLLASPCRMVRLLDMNKVFELLSLLVAVIEDPVSLGVTSAHYLINRKKFRKILGTTPYVITAVGAIGHMLLEAWKWTPRVRDEGWGVLLKASDLRSNTKPGASSALKGGALQPGSGRFAASKNVGSVEAAEAGGVLAKAEQVV